MNETNTDTIREKKVAEILAGMSEIRRAIICNQEMSDIVFEGIRHALNIAFIAGETTGIEHSTEIIANWDVVKAIANGVPLTDIEDQLDLHENLTRMGTNEKTTNDRTAEKRIP